VSGASSLCAIQVLKIMSQPHKAQSAGFREDFGRHTDGRIAECVLVAAQKKGPSECVR
jgi:hypothetical protein